MNWRTWWKRLSPWLTDSKRTSPATRRGKRPGAARGTISECRTLEWRLDFENTTSCMCYCGMGQRNYYIESESWNNPEFPVCQVIESPCTNGKAVEMEPKTMMNSHHSYEPIDSIDYHSVERIPLKTSDNMRAMVNHDDTLEVLYRSVRNVKCYEYGYWSKFILLLLLLFHSCVVSHLYDGEWICTRLSNIKSNVKVVHETHALWKTGQKILHLCCCHSI